MNVHSTNWMWINKAALDKAGGKEPQNWDELVALLDNFKEQGITPIAHGGQPWQDATIFDAVVLSLGTDFYKQAFIDLDPAALERHKQIMDRQLRILYAGAARPGKLGAATVSPEEQSGSRSRMLLIFLSKIRTYGSSRTETCLSGLLMK